jgi:hypothetical protein
MFACVYTSIVQNLTIIAALEEGYVYGYIYMHVCMYALKTAWHRVGDDDDDDDEYVNMHMNMWACM